MGNKVTILETKYTLANTIMTIRCREVDYKGVVELIHRRNGKIVSITLLENGRHVDIDFEQGNVSFRPILETEMRLASIYPHLPLRQSEEKLVVLDTINRTCLAEIIETRAGGAEMKIHYVGWDNKWDEWLGSTSPRILRDPVLYRKLSTLHEVGPAYIQALNDAIRLHFAAKTAWHSKLDLRRGEGLSYLPLPYRYLYGNLKRNVLSFAPRLEKALYTILHGLVIPGHGYEVDPQTLVTETKVPLVSGRIAMHRHYNGKILNADKYIHQASQIFDLPYYHENDPLGAFRCFEADGQVVVAFAIRLGESDNELSVWSPASPGRILSVKKSDLLPSWHSCPWKETNRDAWAKVDLNKITFLKNKGLNLNDITRRIQNETKRPKYGNRHIAPVSECMATPSAQRKVGQPLLYKSSNGPVVHIITAEGPEFVVVVDPFRETETKVPVSNIIPFENNEVHVSLLHLIEWLVNPCPARARCCDGCPLETTLRTFWNDQINYWKEGGVLPLKLRINGETGESFDLLHLLDEKKLRTVLDLELEICGFAQLEIVAKGEVVFTDTIEGPKPAPVPSAPDLPL